MIDDAERARLLRERVAQLEREHFLNTLALSEVDEGTDEHAKAMTNRTAIQRRIERLIGPDEAPQDPAAGPLGDDPGEPDASGAPPIVEGSLNPAEAHAPGGTTQ